MHFVSLVLTEAPSPDTQDQPSLLHDGSVMWRFSGDWRLGLVLGRALLMQVCHPTIGAAVGDVSIFETDPWGRLEQSLIPVIKTTYAADGAEVGARIRAAHRTIRGVDARGRRYNAWEPEAYWFVLATGVDSIMLMADRFCGEPLSSADRARIVAETREVGLRMGLRARDMPSDWDAFERSYQELLCERLENHPTAHRVLDMLAAPPVPPDVPLPRWLGPAFSVPVGHLLRLVTVGTLPAVVRERLGLSWSTAQELELHALAAVVRTTFRVIPEPLRYMPVARDGFRRERAAGSAA